MVQFMVVWYLVFATTLFLLECWKFFKQGYNRED